MELDFAYQMWIKQDSLYVMFNKIEQNTDISSECQVAALICVLNSQLEMPRLLIN